MPKAQVKGKAKRAAAKQPSLEASTKSKADRARRPAAPASDPLALLREIIRAWPETFERISHGAPTWWGGKRTFATFTVNHHGDGRIAVWCKLPPGAQEALVESDPLLFFVPPYVGPSGWVGIRLDEPEGRATDWVQVAGLLEEGYRSVAPRRAIAALDAR